MIETVLVIAAAIVISAYAVSMFKVGFDYVRIQNRKADEDD